MTHKVPLAVYVWFERIGHRERLDWTDCAAGQLAFRFMPRASATALSPRKVTR